MALLWRCCGAAVALLWRRCGAVALLWPCSGVAVAHKARAPHGPLTVVYVFGERIYSSDESGGLDFMRQRRLPAAFLGIALAPTAWNITLCALFVWSAAPWGRLDSTLRTLHNFIFLGPPLRFSASDFFLLIDFLFSVYGTYNLARAYRVRDFLDY